MKKTNDQLPPIDPDSSLIDLTDHIQAMGELLNSFRVLLIEPLIKSIDELPAELQGADGTIYTKEEYLAIAALLWADGITLDQEYSIRNLYGMSPEEVRAIIQIYQVDSDFVN